MTTLFGASWCPACRQAKEFLDKNKIEYEYIDVDDMDKRDFILSKGIRSIPVLETDAETVIGFDTTKYKELLF